MRRLFCVTLISASLLASSAAFGADDPPPPPPPPGEDGGGSSAGSSVRARGALLDASDQGKRPMMISAFLGLPYYYGIGVGFGGRFYIPILHNGFISTVNDSFGIEFGADFSFHPYFGGSFFNLDVPVEARWNFHVFEKLEVYAKAGLGLSLIFGNYGPYLGYYTGPVGVLPRFVGNVGLLYHLNKNVSLRAEVGYPWAKIGIGIAL